MELFQNIGIRKCNVIPISDKYIRKNLKEISKERPNFSYKLFLYNNYFNKIWSFSQAFLQPPQSSFYSEMILY